LQVLRGFAATSVAGYHLHEAALNEGGNPGIFSLFKGGEIGVDIFFVISGFIMFYIAQGRTGLTWQAFMKARFWRILPPYWVILSLYVIAAFAMMVVLGDSSRVPDIQSFIISYLLLPYPDHIIIIAWTLSVELLFYIVFALTFFAKGLKATLVAMLVWVGLAFAFTYWVENQVLWLSFALNSVVLEFLFGILLGVYFHNTEPKARKLQMPALVLGAAWVLFHMASGGFEHVGLGREFHSGIPAALLVYGILGLNIGDRPVLEIWGESSYILYLLHILWFSIIGKLVLVATDFNVYHSQVAMIALLVSVVVVKGGYGFR